MIWRKKVEFFPSKQFFNVTELITLEMRLKPGFVLLRAGILDLYPTSLYFNFVFYRLKMCRGACIRCYLQHCP